MIYGGTALPNTFLTATYDRSDLSRFQRHPDGRCNQYPIHSQSDRRLARQFQRLAARFCHTGRFVVLDTFDLGRAHQSAAGEPGVNGSGASQSSVLVVLVGNVFGLPASLQGVIHGSILSNATAQPMRINSYYQTPVDGAGNSFYGKNSITGFALSPGAGASNAVEVNTATQTIATNYQFAQAAIPTGVPAAANGAQTTQTLFGFFGGIMTKEPTAGVGSPLPYAVTGNTSISTNASNSQIAATLTGGDPFTSSCQRHPGPGGKRHRAELRLDHRRHERAPGLYQQQSVRSAGEPPWRRLFVRRRRSGTSQLDLP